jgi:acylphosphatase
MAKVEAVEASVSGDDQQVGFRALVMKQAIEFNLAGAAQNDPNQVVRFTLQGDKKRINSALATIEKGTKRSSGITVSTSPATIDSSLDTFTIVDWTSSRRNITTKYNLVFRLRSDDSEISSGKAEDEWHKILEKTLDAEDLKKLHPDD